jgi:hypothetical protein
MKEKYLQEKAKYFRGWARIEFQSLSYGRSPLEIVRNRDDPNVDRLLRNFQEDGCHRDNPDNYVKVIIPDRVLV